VGGLTLSDLRDTKIKDTFGVVLQVPGGATALTSTLVALQDGRGGATILDLSATAFRVRGDLNVTGQITGGLTVPSGRVLAVDAVNGNDSAAARGNLSKPFLTPAAALAAAAAGDLIDVYPGTYTLSAPLGADGVNWLLRPGVTLTGANGVFAAASAMTYEVNGPGARIITTAATNTGKDAVKVSHASAAVTVRGLRISATTVNTQAQAVLNTAGTLTVDGCTIDGATASGRALVLHSGGLTRVRGCRVTNTGSSANAALTAAAGLVLANCTLSSGGASLDAAAPQTVVVEGVLTTDKDKGTNVTLAGQGFKFAPDLATAGQRNVRVADQFPGADLGAQITAALADLGSTPGEVWVYGGTMSTQVVVTPYHTVRILGEVLNTYPTLGAEYLFVMMDHTSLVGVGPFGGGVSIIHETTYPGAANDGLVGAYHIASDLRGTNGQGTNTDIHVYGIKFQGRATGAGGNNGSINLGNSTHSSVTYCWFNDLHNLVCGFGGYGDSGNFANDWRIDDNLFTNYAIAAWCVNGINGSISRNVFLSPGTLDGSAGGAPIDLEPNTTADFDASVVVDGNFIDLTNGNAPVSSVYAISNNHSSVFRTGPIKITNNVIVAGTMAGPNANNRCAGGIGSSTDDVLIAHNVLRSCGQFAIQISGQRGLVQGNTVAPAAGGGATLSVYGTNHVFTDNVVFDAEAEFPGYSANNKIRELDLTSLVVNTAGTAVLWVGGGDGQWSPWMAGRRITINSVDYTVAGVTDPYHLTLTTSAGTQTGVGAVVYTGGSKYVNNVVDTYDVSAESQVSLPTLYRSAAGAPTTADCPDGRTLVWKDSGSGLSSVYYNDGGTLLSAPLADDGVYARQQNFSNGSLTDAATIAWDLAAKQSTDVTLGGNRTLANPTHQVNHGRYTLRVIQDGTGGRTLAYGSAYQWPGGTAPVLTADPGAVDVIEFTSDGTSMYGVPHLAFAGPPDPYAALKVGIAGYYKLDEASGNAVDASGHVNLVAAGSPGAGTGVLNGCRTFNGSNQRFSAAAGTSLQTAGSSFTLTGWVKLTDLGGVYALWGKGTFAGFSNVDYDLEFTSAGAWMRVIVGTGSSSVILTATNVTLTAGTWCFVAAGYDAGTGNLFIRVNGASRMTASLGGSPVVTTSLATLGAWGPGNGAAFKGSIDEAGMWLRALSDGELDTLYGSGTPPAIYP
jgi:hypothetical protein